MGIFEEESAEDAAFWENPTGPPAAPAGVDPDQFQASITETEAPAEPAEEESAEEAPEAPAEPEEEGSPDVEGDEPGAEVGSPEPDPSAERLTQLESRLETYERRINEKDEFINRQANEIGELRKTYQQQSTMSGWDEVLDDNPAQAAELALNAGDRRRYLIAREAWEDISPGAAANFERAIALERELAEVKQQLDQRIGPVQEQQELQQVASAYSTVKERYPDYDDHEQAMGQMLETRPLLKESLQSVLRNGNQEEQAAALEDLYLLAVGRKRDTLSDAERTARQTTADASAAQRQAAAVVTGGASPEIVGKSIADKIGDEWDEIASPYEEGWQV